MSSVIKINPEQCVGCGLCVHDCPMNALKISNQKAVMTADHCMECGHCLAVCPKGAVSMTGYDMNEVLPYKKESFDIDAEKFLNRIKFRRSVRHFRSKTVEREKLENIIEAGRFTPTGTNKQHIRYIVMENPEKQIEPLAVAGFQKLMKLAKAVGKVIKLPLDLDGLQVEPGFFFHGAPVVIFVISDDAVDASLASANMETMAQAQGLGVFYVGLFVLAARLIKSIRKDLHLTKRKSLSPSSPSDILP